MSAETVTLKIEEKALAAAEAIIIEAKENAEKESAVTLANAGARADKMLEAAKLNAEIAERGRAQADSLNTKLGILAAKREMLATARAEAKAKLVKMSDGEFVRIFSKYLSESELSGEYTLAPSSVHEELCKKNLAELAKNAGISLTIVPVTDAIDTGFMLIADNYDVEFSIDAILDSVFEANEKEIADILFETGDVK